MPDYTQLTQQQLVNLLNSYERRLRALETAPRAGYTQITKDGKIEILDVNGKVRMKLGADSDGSDVGIWLYNPAGEIVAIFGTDGDASSLLMFAGDDLDPVLAVTDTFGFSKPQYTLPIWPDPFTTVDSAGRPTTTSASFDTLFNFDFVAVAPNVSGSIAVNPGAGNTVSVQVTVSHLGGTEFAMFTQTGITVAQYVNFDAVIPAAALEGDGTDVLGKSFRIRVKCARTAGASTASLGVFEPFSNHV